MEDTNDENRGVIFTTNPSKQHCVIIGQGRRRISVAKICLNFMVFRLTKQFKDQIFMLSPGGVDAALLFSPLRVFV